MRTGYVWGIFEDDEVAEADYANDCDTRDLSVS